MNRRTFLKGMLAIAGGVAIAQVPDFDIVFAEEITDEPLFVKPRGRLGSIRLNDHWYSLEDASLSMRRTHSPLIQAPDPDRIGQYKVVGGGNLVDSAWSAEFFVSETLVFMLERGDPEIDFEVESAQYRFSGKGYLENVQVSNLTVDEGKPMFGVGLEGLGKINRHI